MMILNIIDDPQYLKKDGLKTLSTIFIKVTLATSSTQINYFILTLTLSKFLLHFNGGAYGRGGVEHGTTEGALDTRRDLSQM